MTHDPVEVAKGLDDAGRAVVLRGSDVFKAALLFRDDYDGRKAARDIKATGLFEHRLGGSQILIYRLTSLGWSVKAHLESLHD